MSKNLTIMLVDDNKIDLFIHSEVIKRIPFVTDISQYTFVSEALNFLEENEKDNWPDVIMLDIHMPILNGFDFLDSYKKLSPASRAKSKLVIVSSTLDNEDLEKARTNSEVFALLEKPLKPEKLKDLLSSLQ